MPRQATKADMETLKDEHELTRGQEEEGWMGNVRKKEADGGASAVEGDMTGPLDDQKPLPIIRAERTSSVESSQPIAGPSRLPHYYAGTPINPPRTDHTAHQAPPLPQLADNSQIPPQSDIEAVPGPPDVTEHPTDEAMRQRRTARPKQNTQKGRSLARKDKKEREPGVSNRSAVPHLNDPGSSSNHLAHPEYSDLDRPMRYPVRRVGRKVGPMTEARKRLGEKMVAAEARKKEKAAAKEAKESAKAAKVAARQNK